MSILIEMIEDDLDSVKDYVSRLTPEKQKKIARVSKHIQNGLYALAPMTCHGPEKCCFINHCPIPEVVNGELEYGPREDYPIARPCILENIYIKQKTREYIEWLKVDVENPIEMSIVNDLALIDLYKNRATMIMSSGDRGKQGMDFLRIDEEKIDNGNGEKQLMITKSVTQMHPVFLVIDKLEARRERLLDKLLETRKAKSELAMKMGKKKESSQLLDEIKALRNALISQQTEVQQITMKEEMILLKD